MTISFPLSLPAQGFASIRIVARDVVATGESPFSLNQQLQQHTGQRMEADVSYPPMRDEAIIESVIVFLLSLKGRTGTLLMPADPLRTTPRGTWAPNPPNLTALALGAQSAGASTIAIHGMLAAATVKAGDWFQVGTGSASRMHKVLGDVTANGSGQISSVDIWPNLREAVAHDAPIVSDNPKCVWRLASNERSWNIGLAQIYGISFSAVEAL